MSVLLITEYVCFLTHKVVNYISTYIINRAPVICYLTRYTINYRKCKCNLYMNDCVVPQLFGGSRISNKFGVSVTH